jgi:long-chain acyl-CoA synthetase
MSGTPEANVASLLHASATDGPHRPAVVAGSTRLDYAGLEVRAARCAALLRDHGVARGDRVAILLPNVPEFIDAYYGALRLGAIAVPLNFLLKEPEIEHRIEDSRACVLVAPPERTEGSAPHIHPADADDTAPDEEIAAVEPGDTAVILYTSARRAPSSPTPAYAPSRRRSARSSASPRRTSSSAQLRSRTCSGSPQR